MLSVRDTSSRGVAVILAVLALVAIVFGGFVQTSNTDAAWTDHKLATGSFSAAEVVEEVPEIGPFLDGHCKISNGGPPHSLTLTWVKPANLEDIDVVYDISWRVVGSKDFTFIETKTEPRIGPFIPEVRHGSDTPPTLEYMVQARIDGSDQHGPPIVFQVWGPRGAGVLDCKKITIHKTTV